MRKYKRGKRIKSVADYESKAQFLDYFMVGDRTTARGWIESWQYRFLKNTIASGMLYEALPIDFKTDGEAKNEEA